MSASELKEEQRAAMRSRRQGLDTATQAATAIAISQLAQGLPNWNRANRVGVYLESDGEVSTSKLAEVCRSEGRELYLPVVLEDKTLEFARWGKGAPLIKNRFNIQEPAADAPRCDVNFMDILFLPLVGWDRAGNRLGMGGGYYDRSLEHLPRPLLVGLAHSFQELDELEGQPWDIALDWVITEQELHRCENSL